MMITTFEKQQSKTKHFRLSSECCERLAVTMSGAFLKYELEVETIERVQNYNSRWGMCVLQCI